MKKNLVDPYKFIKIKMAIFLIYQSFSCFLVKLYILITYPAPILSVDLQQLSPTFTAKTQIYSVQLVNYQLSKNADLLTYLYCQKSRYLIANYSVRLLCLLCQFILNN